MLCRWKPVASFIIFASFYTSEVDIGDIYLCLGGQREGRDGRRCHGSCWM